MLGHFVAVAVGGALGAVLRAAVSVAMPAAAGGLAPTLVVNLGAAAALGAIVGLARRRPLSPRVSAFLATGLLGSLSTYSTFAVEVHELLLAGRVVVAIGYAVGSVVLGIAAAWTGRRIAIGFATPRSPAASS
ncbi:MAG: CrcB family protein [Nitriliruptoraceae bacterium]